VKERLGVPNPISNSKVLNALQPKASLALQSEAVEKVHIAVCYNACILRFVTVSSCSIMWTNKVRRLALSLDY
jgi:hypothetical protein